MMVASLPRNEPTSTIASPSAYAASTASTSDNNASVSFYRSAAASPTLPGFTVFAEWPEELITDRCHHWVVENGGDSFQVEQFDIFFPEASQRTPLREAQFLVRDKHNAVAPRSLRLFEIRGELIFDISEVLLIPRKIYGHGPSLSSTDAGRVLPTIRSTERMAWIKAFKPLAQ
jgi:hypothetical protein